MTTPLFCSKVKPKSSGQKSLSDQCFGSWNLTHVLSVNMEDADFMSYTAASQQGELSVFLSLLGEMISSIFLYRLWFTHAQKRGALLLRLARLFNPHDEPNKQETTTRGADWAEWESGLYFNVLSLKLIEVNVCCLFILSEQECTTHRTTTQPCEERL